ncbi:hypothetical protein ATO6_20585 [Oceanicola sp. 22II-s10i]|uniref:TRAP transporter small permease n=1 Tax=Oceanicola sp. 22II-s10i TaxID=1317116 RepID=UPI000B526B3B|nr:TRAP transporter small permease [Oceanicola sp. 22II-s10i]OWU83031.1 hypothetical protein ATO6_20585 [Oceanicola sp. 22II-s10i]
MWDSIRSQLYYDPPAGQGPAGRVLAALESAFLGISVLTIIVLTLVISISVIGRNVFAAPIPDDIIIAENMMPLIVCLPFALVTARRGNLEVEIFTGWLPVRANNALSALGHLLGFLCFTAIAWCVWDGVLRDLDTRQYYEGMLHIPVWPGKVIFVLGVVTFCFRLLLNTLSDIRRTVTGEELAPHDVPQLD